MITTASSSLRLQLAGAADTERLGMHLSSLIKPGFCVYLYGELGTGKTTLVRGLLRAWGHQGAVKSPTYTLIEPYSFSRDPESNGLVLHCDLYRLADAAELEYLGISELASRDNILLIEWPQRGLGLLPAADLSITLSYGTQQQGRHAWIEALSSAAGAGFADFIATATR